MSLYNRKMYFGTRGYMQWVPACATSPDFARVGWSSQMNYLNGGAGVRNSAGSHREYSMTWDSAKRDDLRPISDYASGIYDASDGINLIYWLDPMAMDKNLLPIIWSAPSQAAADGLSLTPGQDPTIVSTSSNTLGYPARSAVYRTNVSSQTVWIPLPAGFTAWVGVHGAATGDAAVTVTPTSGFASLTPVEPAILDVTDSTRVNTAFDSADCDGITIGLSNGGLSSTDTLTLAGLIVQVLPTGTTPSTGGFISGQGHSGCQFLDKPVETPRSAALDRVALSAKLVETGTWL